MKLAPYDRISAVAYAHLWAYGRNPKFYDYEELGGDCTNFASQCLYAGGGLMNYTPEVGWYYISGSLKAPAWTGVEYLYRFLTREERSVGPCGREVSPEGLQPGDLVQLSFDGRRFSHTPVVVAVSPSRGGLRSILVSAHSEDSDLRPLTDYPFRAIRCLHITGIIAPP